MNERVTVVMPALNEAGAVGPMVRRLREAIPEVEVLVVDDGSTDGTGAEAEAAGARVVRHEITRGYGASLKTGVMAAEEASYVLFCDADGQHRIEDVQRVLAHAGHCDMAVGARTRDSHAPVNRRPGKWFLRCFANYLACQDIPDFNSGLRLIRRPLLLNYLHLMPDGFSFSTTSTFALLKSGRVIHWEPITVAPRVGASTVRQWKHGPQTLMLILRLTVLFDPLRVFLHISAGLGVLTLISLVKDVITTPWAGLGAVTTICAIATVLIFLFGLLCDQVSAIRRELHAYHQR